MEIWHVDPEVKRKLIELRDALVAFEERTGEKDTFIFLPHRADRKPIVYQTEKPILSDFEDIPFKDIIFMALRERK